MSRVVIRNVSPEGLHGFRRGQLLLEGLDDSLTVVFAPNATGKSTLAKALGLLLNPKGAGDAIVSGIVACDGVEEARSVRRKDEPFPGAPDRPEDYQLDIIRLLSGLDDTERRSLSQLVGGGLNIAPGTLPVVSSSVTKQANDAKSALTRARNQGDAAADDENRLPFLRQQQEDAQAAAKSFATLTAWRDQKRAEEKIRSLRDEIFALISTHPGLEKQPERASATAKALAKALADAEAGVAEARSSLVKAHPEGAIPPRPLTDVKQASIAAAGKDLVLARQGLTTAKVEHRRKVAGLEALRNAVIRLVDPTDLESLASATAQDFTLLTQAAIEADQRRSRESELTGYKRAHDEWIKRTPEATPNAEETIRAICQWLEAEPAMAEDGRPNLLLGIAAVGAFLIAFLPNTGLRIAGAVLVLGAAAAVWVGQKPKTTGNRRPEFAGAAGLATNATVTDAANRLAQISAAKSHAEAARTLETLAGESLSPLDWQTVASRLRLLSDNPYQLSAVSRAVADYLRSAQDVEGSAAVVSEAESRVDAVRGALSKRLEAFGFPHDVESPEYAEKAFFDWFSRAEALGRAQEAVRNREGDLQRYLADAGMPEGDDRISQLEYREPLAARLRQLHTDLTASEETLSRNAVDAEAVRPALGTEPDLASDEEIDSALARLEEQASHRDLYFSQLVECQKRISDIEKNAALPEAEDRYAVAMRGVESKWNELARDAVRYRIKTHLTERMRTVELPEIIRNANEWARSFTAGRYRLILGPANAGSKDGLGVLSVQDTRTGREQRFGELSTGTKVHLVLALRLGLIERHELQANAGTRRFPLIADEVMAVSDPEASRALAVALAEISKARQVIVFTNQPDDVRVFREVLPGVVVKTLGSAEPAEEGETDLPKYQAPVGPRRFDLRLPVWAHAKEAILPAHLETTGDCEPLFEALETLRQELVRDYPRLAWEDIAGASWTNNNFREGMRDLAHRSAGNARKFLDDIVVLPRFRKVTAEEAEAWLSDRGYLTEAPDESEIRRRTNAHVNGAIDPFQVDYVVRLLVSAF